MFTGIVEAVGTLRARAARGGGARVTIACPFEALTLGESIAVDGVCLTVDAIGTGSFDADCSKETLDKTTLGSLALSGGVNLERAAALGARMGGHLVSGHVDGVGALAELRPVGDAFYVAFTMPADLARFVAVKGSVTVNGVSLTVNEASRDRFAVTLIPHTMKKTTLGALSVGSPVNLEVDVVARYVARLVEVAAEDAKDDPTAKDASLLAKLKSAGFV